MGRGAGTAVEDEDGDTPMINAIYDGHIEVIRTLLDRGANHASPLGCAAYNGHLEIARLLLERGADPNIADKHGNPPIHGAAENDYPEIVTIVTLLLKKGADQTVVDPEGDSSLMCAIFGAVLK